MTQSTGLSTVLVLTIISVSAMQAVAGPATKPAKPEKIIPRMSAHEPSFPPQGEPKVYDIKRAIRYLSGKDSSERNGAARFLGTSQVDDDYRAEVLKLLEPDLHNADPSNALLYVQAYANWADRKHVAALQSVFDNPVVKRMPAATEKCWATALEALVRLDERAAEESMIQRIDVFFFRTEVPRYLAPAAESDTDVAPSAKRLIDMVNSYDPQVGVRRSRPPRQSPKDSNPPIGPAAGGGKPV